MPDKIKYLLLILICAFAQATFAQSSSSYPNNSYPSQSNQKLNLRDTSKGAKVLTADQELDTLRKRLDKKKDTVVFSSKFIKVTNERLLRDSTQLRPLDTSIINFENYNPLLQPRSPKISLGGVGLSERSLLFEPSKTIGFDAGQHELDAYTISPQDINYYRARVPLTNLYLVTGGLKEQIFKVVHTQNINPRLNIGFNANFIGSQGFYSAQELSQNVSDVNFAAFTWYESRNKRYNLLANIIYGNLKAPITGSITNDSIFVTGSVSKLGEPPRLANSYEQWKQTGFYVKQFYYIGHIDSVVNSSTGKSSTVLPTQRVSYTLNYNTKKYDFKQNDVDTYNVFPDYYYSSDRSRDSLTVQHFQNDFSYSFYLRPKSSGLVKNEVKLDLGLTQDIYSYTQYVSDTTLNNTGTKVIQAAKVQNNSFQDLTIKGKLSYKFSDKIFIDGDIQQIVQGRDFGDFLYDGKVTLAGGQKAGKIVLEGYTQSSSPPLVYTDWVSNHYIFHNKFNNQKTTSLSFNYLNNPLKLDIKAEYFLISDYLYFTAQTDGIDAHPTQLNSDINLLKISVGKSIAWRRWHFDEFLVYQKTDYQNTLRTPEFYSYTSLYYKAFLFNVLYSHVGIDVRYNSQYVAPSYAPGLGQFYNGANVTFSSYPIASIFFRATLQHTNFFIMYDYVNQGIQSPGYYTVNRYPQMDRLLKIGISWAFYN